MIDSTTQQDFSGGHFRGQSFEGQDLSGADFSRADIRGSNFTNANLRGANFTGSKAGLKKHWVIIQLIVALLIAIGAGVMAVYGNWWAVIVVSDGFKVASDGKEASRIIIPYLMMIPRIAVLAVIIVPFIAIIRQGFTSGGLRIIVSMMAVVSALAVVGGITIAGIVGIMDDSILVGLNIGAGIGLYIGIAGLIGIVGILPGVVAVAGIVAQTSARTVGSTTVSAMASIVPSMVVCGAGLIGALINTSITPESMAVCIGTMATVVVLSIYVARRTLAGDEKYTSIRTVAVALMANGGTSFHNADLTEANFTGARLNNTDLREANLTRTCWRDVQKLNLVRLEGTYLKNALLRRLLITGEGQGQNFERQNLRGVNLQKANLAYASLKDTDLSQANLQEANLFEAKLVQTNLDQTNLSNAHLTGAYIEDWGITRRTRLEGVKCKYVYLKLPTKGDQDPSRMPPSEQGEFGENDFNIFITSVLDTLDLYHRNDINAGLAITIIKSLTEDYPVQFELVGVEKRGNDQFVIRLKVFGQSSHFQLQREYYARYEQTLPLYDPKKLMSNTDVVVEEIVRTVKDNPGTRIENLHNQGIVITGGRVSMSSDHNINAGIYNEQSGNLGIGHMSGGEIKGNAKVAGEINEAEEQNLTQAAADIQALLKQLEQTYPTNTTTSKMTLATEAIQRIDNDPKLTRRILSALKAGGTSALDSLLDHPAASFVISALEDWQQTKSS